MGLSVNGAVQRAEQVARWMATQEKFRAKAGEKLSSGLRINRASDDAAGLAISETLATQVRGDLQAGKNILDGISLLNLAEGGMDRIADILQRMRELAVQSAHGVYTDEDRAAIQSEFFALKQQINLISEGSEFNTMNLLRGVDPGTTATTNIVTAPMAAGTGQTDGTSVVSTTFGFGNNTVGQSIALPGGAEVYPGSFDVQVIPPPPGGAPWVYNPGTQSIDFTGATTDPAPGADVPDVGSFIVVRYIPTGSLTFNLSGMPNPPGQADVRVNGALVPPGDYTIVGNTFTLTGSLPPATTAGNITVGYMTGQLSPSFSLANASLPNMEGGIVSMNSVTVTNTSTGATTAIPADPANGYSLQTTLMGYVGDTPLYNYVVQLNGTARDAVGAGPFTVTFDYDLQYPDPVDPVSIDIQSGANQGQITTVEIDRVTVGGLWLVNTTADTMANAETAIGDLDRAIGILSANRGKVGAGVNRLEHAYANVTNAAEMQDRARSFIRDTDMASTLTDSTNRQILFNAGAGMFKQATFSAQYLLQLLG